MSSQQVLIRTDASREIGLGHLARCMSLAGTLRELGAAVTFLMRAPSDEVRARIVAQGYACEAIDGAVVAGSAEDVAATRQLAGRLGPACIAIVDHYGIDAQWERSLRSSVAKLVVIDDLADRLHECDLLIDQNRPFDGDRAYRDLVPPNCRLLTGPRFALLRSEFAAWRARPRSRDGQVRRVLICFGGSDPGGHTLVALRAAMMFASRLEHTDVVVGPLNAARREIEALASQGRVSVHVDPPDLAALLHETDLAIGGGGMSSWERLCLSVPAIAAGIVANQTQNVRDLIRLGVAVGAPEGTAPDESLYASWLSVLLEASDLVQGMAERASTLVDGDGAARVARRLLVKAPLTFRPAGPADSAMIHAWRNHPATRAVSLDAAEIPLDAHERWYARSLADSARLIVVAEADGEPVGVARFDLAGSEAIISVFKDPETTGPLDLVSEATRWLLDSHGDIVRIRATVLADNRRSLQAFEAAGYRLQERHYVIERPSGAG